MHRILIDASVTLAWLFNEADQADKIKSVLDSSDLVAPWLWRLEVTNAVLVRERRKLITDVQAMRFLNLLDELPIDIISEPAERTVINLAELARPHQLSSYDALYLDFARRLPLPLFTRDNNLRDAAKRVGVSLIADQ
jgi:predicted nucleic acid-binding protein